MTASQTVCWWWGWPSVWTPADRPSLQMDLNPENSIKGSTRLPAASWFICFHPKTLHSSLCCTSSFTYIIPRAVAAVAFCLLKGQYLEGGQRSGAWLGRDHPSETSHRPGTNMVVICTHWHAGGPKRPSVQTEETATAFPANLWL